MKPRINGALSRASTIVAILWLISLTLAQAQTAFTLDVKQPAHGMISVSPEMEVYPQGTKITLTATPNEGYRVIDLIILRTGSGNESGRGRTYETATHTFSITEDTEVRATITGAITSDVLFDNLGVRGSGVSTGSALKATLDRSPDYLERPIVVAQRFRAGESGNVTAVEFGFARLGSPGGRLTLDVREVDESTGHPGKIVGNFGDFEVDNAAQIDWCALPLKLEPVRVEGFVGGLEPDKDYFFMMAEMADDLPGQSEITNDPCLQEGATTPVIDLVPLGANGQVGDAVKTLFDWPYPEFDIPEGWVNWDPNNSLTMRFRIEGTPQTNVEILYDNLEETGVGDVRKVGPTPGVGGAAQEFTAGPAGNVTSVTLGLGRVGEPGGNLIVSIFTVDDQTGFPGERIEVLNTVEIDSLEQFSWGAAAPSFLEFVTINGNVGGLTPGQSYYLHVIHDDDVILESTPDGRAPRHGWFVAAVARPDGCSIEDCPPIAFDGWIDFDPSTPGWWHPWSGDSYMHARIAGTATPEPTTDPFTIVETEEGVVTKVPDLDRYPIGSTATVTATPEPGFEFVKWQYGDVELTDNPAEITIEEGLTLTPQFAPVTPEPINVEILPAMAIRWDSQLGQTYEVQSSPDLENWTTEAEGVEGTGELMTHFFIREAREMYYRVLESE
ncbi:MAG: hypothetical protein R3F19_23995 [Verrucomicrobiales bacterium]